MRSNAAATIACAWSGVCSANSNASIGPRPRTSPIAAWRAASSLEPATHRLAESRRLRQELRLGDRVEHGDRRGAGERVAAEGAAEPTGRNGVHQLGAARDGGERQAAADRLAGDEQVRLDALVVLDRPHLPRAPDARLDLVVDVEDPVLAADLQRGAAGKSGGIGRKPPSPWTGSSTTHATVAGSTSALKSCFRPAIASSIVMPR